jgi:hypothetical protein
MNIHFLATFICLLLLSSATFPQAHDSDLSPKHHSSILNAANDSTAPEDVPAAISLHKEGNIFNSFEFLLSLIVLGFGTVVVSLEVYLAKINVIKSEHVFKCLIITLVIIAALVLITAGYSNNQINGISGILGSIAGYLLGKTDNPQQPDQIKKEHADTKP